LSASALVETSDFADELYEFLISIDPAVWRDDAAAARLESFMALRARADELQGAWSEMSEAASSQLYERFCELHENLALDEMWAEAASECESLRLRLTPLYEAMVAELRVEGERVKHVHPTNYWRNGVHVFSGVSLTLAFEHVMTWYTMMLIACAWVTWSWTLEITRRRSVWWNDILMTVFGKFSRPHERYRVNSATWYGTALFGVVLTAPNYCGVMGMLILAVGDPAASICGRKFGKTKLIGAKSLEGSLAFAAVGWAASFTYLSVYYPQVSVGARLVLTLTAGVVGAVVELISTRIEDNVTIPLGVAWVTMALAWVLGIVPVGL
jgi:dolichol kinase